MNEFLLIFLAASDLTVMQQRPIVWSILEQKKVKQLGWIEGRRGGVIKAQVIDSGAEMRYCHFLFHYSFEELFSSRLQWSSNSKRG